MLIYVSASRLSLASAAESPARLSPFFGGSSELLAGALTRFDGGKRAHFSLDQFTNLICGYIQFIIHL